MTTMTDITSEQVPAISNGYRLQFEDAQDTWVLLYPEGMVKLNPTASQILQRCDGKTSVQDIVAQLEAAFETTGLSDDVQGFLAIACEQHWIKLS